MIDEEMEKNMTKCKIIIDYYENNLSIYNLKKKYNLPFSQISGWIKKFGVHKDVNACIKKGGRKKILIKEIKQLIYQRCRDFSNFQVKSLVDEIKENFNVKLSESTIRRFLHKLGKYKVPKVAAPLSLTNQNKRLAYCLSMMTHKLRNIIFTDETFVRIGKRSKKVFCLEGAQAYQRVHHKAVGVMCFGAISMRGKVFFKVILDYDEKKRGKP